MTNKLIAGVRISGQVGLSKDVVETLNRLRLGKKYSCVVVNPTKENLGMIKKLNNFIAFGDVNDETLKKLIEKRGKLINKSKKMESEKVVDGLTKGKKYEELNLKPFFRLHPPRKGIDSKKHFGVGKGVLGNNREKINELIERML